MKHILGRVVVHVAQLADVPVKSRKIQFVGLEHGAGFVQGPGKVVAVVVEIDVGILRGVKAAAIAIGHHGIQPGNDLLRGLAKVFADEALKSMHVIAQQLGVVVEHLFEVRHHPALVDAIAVEAAGELVVDAAARHLFKRDGEGFAGLRVAAVDCLLKQQIESGRDEETWAASRIRRCADRIGAMAEAAILSTSARVSSPPRPEKLSLCSIAAITLAADSSASSRRSFHTWAMASSTRPNPGRP